MDCPAQGAGTLAVDDAHLKDPLPLTGSHIFGDEIFYLSGLEGMQIQDAVNGQGDGCRITHVSYIHYTQISAMNPIYKKGAFLQYHTLTTILVALALLIVTTTCRETALLLAALAKLTH